LAIAQFRWAGAKDAGVISEEMEYIEIALIQANQQATKTPIFTCTDRLHINWLFAVDDILTTYKKAHIKWASSDFVFIFLLDYCPKTAAECCVYYYGYGPTVFISS
jgi:hypothetical protein